VGQGFQGHFGADPAGIAQGDSQERQGHKKPRGGTIGIPMVQFYLPVVLK
jgi:hypothetical protein